MPLYNTSSVHGIYCVFSTPSQVSSHHHLLPHTLCTSPLSPFLLSDVSVFNTHLMPDCRAMSSGPVLVL